MNHLWKFPHSNYKVSEHREVTGVFIFHVSLPDEIPAILNEEQSILPASRIFFTE